jgi:apolipoprotein N-acyltransferase
LSRTNDLVRNDGIYYSAPMMPRSREPSTKHETLPWYRSTFALAMSGGIILFVAFPPLNVWPLAWIAPLPWIWLVQRSQLAGRRPLLAVWAASSAHWLAMVEGIRQAHYANYLGWLALALYLAIYLPLFIGLTRHAVHGWKVPLLIAAPVVWTGLELVRGHLITGFSLGLLGHTQLAWTPLLQISDVFGAYGVSFVMMLVAAALAQAIAPSWKAIRWQPLVIAATVLIAVLTYGHRRMNELQIRADQATPTLRVALIQESVDKKFEYDPVRNQRTVEKYLALTLSARDRHPDLDLVVWPESVFTGNYPDVIVDGPPVPPPGVALTEDELRTHLQRMTRLFAEKAQRIAQRVNRVWRDGEFRSLDIWMLVGCGTVHVGGGSSRDYNAVLLIDPEGNIVDRYYKMHPVMFGEYIPFGQVLPWIYKLTPLPQGLTPGISPQAFAVKDIRLSSSVCFESTVPHLIRRQLATLTREGTPPDALVNVTDDGWFFGASILDLQLACAVFRAIELRRPMLVAANTGISAWIDEQGRIQQRGPRREPEILFGKLRHCDARSVYASWGDLPAAVCLAACILLAISQLVQHWTNRKRRPTEPPSPKTRHVRRKRATTSGVGAA